MKPTDSLTSHKTNKENPAQESTKNSEHSVQTNSTTEKYTESKNKNYHFESNRQYFSICIYALCVIFIGTFLIYCIVNMGKTKAQVSHLLNTLSPFVIAFFIAYILNPIVVKIRSFFEHTCKIRSKTLSKVLSIILTYLLVLSILAIALIYIIPELGKSIAELSGKFQTIGTDFIHLLQHIETRYPNLNLEVYEEKISDVIMQLVSLGPNMVKQLVPVVFNFSISVVKIVINILLSIVISIYMLNDKKMISKNVKRTLYAFFPKERIDSFLQTAKECNLIFSKFFIGKSLDSFIIGILCFCLMTILKLPYSMLLSVIVAITNMIPYFGPFIGAVPGVVLFLVIHPIKAVIFGIMILALQQFDGLYLGPKILGSSTGLKPLWVIFAITIGGAYAGVLGMFLGVPVVAVIAYLFNKAITQRLERKQITIDDSLRVTTQEKKK